MAPRKKNKGGASAQQKQENIAAAVQEDGTSQLVETTDSTVQITEHVT
jgi:hypothetical protein